jgi:hypothetical protein
MSAAQTRTALTILQWVLVAVFTVAIVIHLLHGLYNVGDLVIYTAAAFAVATGKAA